MGKVEERVVRFLAEAAAPGKGTTYGQQDQYIFSGNEKEVRKRASFCAPFIHIKNDDQFTKTGSGQT
jgi:hypothetical protein